MDETARRAEFARNITQLNDIIASMRAETRANDAAIAISRSAIEDSWSVLCEAVPARV